MKNNIENLEKFKDDLRILSPKEIFRKYLVDDKCYILDETQQMKLKSSICDKFDVQYNNIIIVGSGKLGFSIKPNKRFIPFSESSDIDIAIVSPFLFEKIWKRVNEYVDDNTIYSNYENFCNYLSQNGWIRPDLLPMIDIKNDWFDYFRVLTNSRDFSEYKITAGLYYNYHFLESYQLKCIKQCKETIRNDNASN